jgi:hypothetical protein
MALKIPWANTTAQWYAGSFTGSWFNHLEKSLKHTTETKGWPGYGGGASMPNATYNPQLRSIRQHTWADMSSRALRDSTTTAVRENRDFVFQLEIVCFSDKAMAASVSGLWVGHLTDTHMEDIARIDLWLHQRLGLPLTTGVTWTPGKAGPSSAVRLTGPEYDAARGIVGHMHASGNTHWDPGGFDINRYFRALTRIQPPEEDDMSAKENWEYDLADIILKQPVDAGTQLRAARADANNAWETAKRIEKQVEALAAKVDQLLTPPA